MKTELKFDAGALPQSLTQMPAGDFASLRFAGYAALFDTPDAGRDVIRPGAFARSLEARRVTGDAFPLLWQHRPDQRIGWVERIAEDKRGLRVVARIDNPQSLAAKQVLDGKLTGISFGYRAVSARTLSLTDGREGRELAEIDLFEVSLVTKPMQHRARIHFVA